MGGFNSVLTVDCDVRLEVVSYSTDGNDITINLGDVAPGIHDLRVSAASVDGRQARPVLLKYHLGVSVDWRDALLYFAVTDRFYNGDPQNDAPVADVDERVNYQGGDFEGIRQKIVSGYFGDLGVSAICISWPVQLDQVESRFGTLAELRAMVNAADGYQRLRLARPPAIRSRPLSLLPRPRRRNRHHRPQPRRRPAGPLTGSLQPGYHRRHDIHRRARRHPHSPDRQRRHPLRHRPRPIRDDFHRPVMVDGKRCFYPETRR